MTAADTGGGPPPPDGLVPAGMPAVRRLVDLVLDVWPAHADHLARRFAGETPRQRRSSEALAGRLLRVIEGQEERFARNYHWTCLRLMEEEFHFGATGRYRHASFAEVRDSVYGDPAFMAPYADGLLLSQLLWTNHARSLGFYEHRVLPALGRDARVLEVGPGHGLLLAMAAERTDRPVVGWDVSATSVEATARALRLLGVDSYELDHQDLFEAAVGEPFDLVVASEVLEHLERPAEALARLLAHTRPGGLLYVNVPVNSPAPDHITLWRTPEEAFGFLTAGGVEIVRSLVSPLTGSTVEQAREQELTLSCAALCRRP